MSPASPLCPHPVEVHSRMKVHHGPPLRATRASRSAVEGVRLEFRRRSSAVADCLRLTAYRLPLTAYRLPLSADRCRSSRPAAVPARRIHPVHPRDLAPLELSRRERPPTACASHPAPATDDSPSSP